MAKKPTPHAPATREKSAPDDPTTRRGRAKPEPDATATPQHDPVKVWEERLRVEQKAYTAWAERFETERLVDYYLGKHWHGLAESDRKKKYVINLIFATVETQIPSLMFNHPTVIVEPRPGAEMESGETVSARATLIQRTLQTHIDDPKMNFGFITKLALRGVYTRFGIVEVGYTADWLDNPNAGKPILKDDDKTPMVNSRGDELKHPAKTLKKGSESLFIKRLDPRYYRVSPGRNVLEENDWVAYGEWHFVEDVKANPEYEHTESLKATGRGVNDPKEQDDPQRESHVNKVLLWKIWDLRAKKRYVLAEGHPKLLQDGKPFTYLPHADLKFYEIEDSFYPLPVIANWLSPQDEINEVREMQKVHRRRFVRRYMREPSVKQSEFEKLETGEDGACIEVSKVDPPPIVAIQDADLSNQNTQVELANSREDLQEVTGVSGEARGLPQSDTATQANIVNVRAQVRESSQRVIVAGWLAKIARLMLLTMREKMQGPLWVKDNIDSQKPDAEKAKDAFVGWQQIKKEDIEELDVDIRIDVSALSPVSEDQQRQAWTVVLSLLADQNTGPLLFMPDPQSPQDVPPLLRKTLMLNGIKSEQEIKEVWRVGQMVSQQRAQAAQAALASKADLPHTTYGFKGEDLSDPLVRLAFMRAEKISQDAVDAMQQPGGVPAPGAPGDSGGGPVAPPQAPGPTTGTPAAAVGGG